MKITENILNSHKEIMEDDEINGSLANTLGDLATEAICDGIKSRKWAEYMKTYASNKDQLKRLCGEDDTFKDRMNMRALAYIVGNAVCTIATRKGDGNVGTLNNIPDGMIEALDFNMNEKTNSFDTTQS